MEKLEELSVRKLREKAMQYPDLRGSFVNYARKDELIWAMQAQSAEEREAVVTAMHNRVQGLKSQSEAVASEEDNGPPSPPVKAAMGGVSGILPALEALNPEAAAEVKALLAECDNLRQLAKAYKSSFAPDVIKGTGDNVVICGRDYPVVSNDDDSPDVPRMDDTFRFSWWRSSRKVGPLTMAATVHDLLKSINTGRNVMLVGAPGVGKTSVVTQYAALTNWPTTRINLNRDFTVFDFVGSMVAENGETKWKDGPFTRAMREGHLVILDEIDHATAEINSILHAALEPGGKLMLTGNHGEVVEKHDRCRFVATSNTAGFGDETGLHPGAQMQDAALLRRFGVCFRVDYMLPVHEVALLIGHGVSDEKTAKEMVAFANDTRHPESGIQYPVSMSQTIEWAHWVAEGEIQTGFVLAVVNKAHDEDAAALVEMAQRRFGSDLDFTSLGGTSND